MLNYKYETHIIKDPLLPFIFRPQDQHTNRACPTNWHENIELLHCTAGAGYVKCGIEDFAFSQGDIFVVNADVPHSVGSNESITYRCLIIHNSFFAENGIPIAELAFAPLIRNPSLAADFEAVADAYSRLCGGGICAAADIRYGVLGLIRKLCAHYTAPKKAELSQSGAYVKKALSYIRQNISQTITLDAVAQHVGISKYHLSREFKIYTGKTIIHTVNLIRCTEAKRLMEGGMHVSDAAAACGFENLSYFTRMFKKLLGCPPSSCIPKATSK